MLRILGRTVTTCLLGLSGFFVEAQTAPDIAKGMGSDAVIRTYGWPKGRSATNGREIWMYDGFQVVFDGGKVVSVTPLSPKKEQPTPRVAPPVQVAAPTRIILPPASPPIILQPVVRPPTPQPSPPVQSARVIPARVLPIEERARQDITPSTPVLLIGSLVFLFGAIATVVSVVKAARKRIEVEEMEAAGRDGAGANIGVPPILEKSWDESLGERLKKFHETSPPLAGPAAAPPGPVSDLTYDLLDSLEWKRFELLVSLYCTQTGARTEDCSFGPDGGVDIQLFRPGEERPYSYVQCKAWERDVDIKPIRELFGVMSADKVPEGAFVTTGDYTDAARAFAEANHIEAINGRGIVERFNQLEPNARIEILQQVTEGDYTTPTCASCGIKMVLRGGDFPFWGCQNYPRCTTRMHLRKSRDG